MLGSPLNMAPEVLNNEEYTNKADIWSIGTVFYELLFGRPPFNANNMVDLLKNIKKGQLDIPQKINKVSPVVEDLLRRMLVVDPKKRIEWMELFSHKINYYLEERIKEDLENTLKSQDFNLSLNMSKFYIKNNMVIQHPAEIKKKEEMNDFAIQIAKGNNSKNTKDYTGKILNRKTERDESPEKKEEKNEKDIEKSKEKDKEKDSGLMEIEKDETAREKLIKTTKKNANRILHERNIYVFLASVAEDSLNNTHIYLSEVVGFLLVKKLMFLIENLKYNLTNKKNLFNLEMWEEFIASKDYTDIFMYILKEYDVFRVYYDQLHQKILETVKNDKTLKMDEYVINVVYNNDKNEKNLAESIQKILKNYCKLLFQDIFNRNVPNNDENKLRWLHLDRILDCISLEKVFKFEDEKKNQFNFKVYYDEHTRYDLDNLVKIVDKKMSQIKFD